MINPVIKNSGTWLHIDQNSDFSIHNIPFGIAKLEDNSIVAVSRLGDHVLNLDALQRDGFFLDQGIDLTGKFNQPVLNDFISLGKKGSGLIRKRIQEIFNDDNDEISDREEFIKQYLIPYTSVQMQMPVKVTDYTDFYSSIEHASNVGSMFRDPSNPLLPNWRHLPVGYHGRASSIVISGTNIHRPNGQIMPQNMSEPIFSPTRMLDFELEMAFVVSRNTQIGESVSVKNAGDYIFGFLLFNDLSARDIQSWEYVPLGPFLSKNFGSVVSPWIVTLEALEPFKINGPEQEPKVLPYLETEGPCNFDINLEVGIKPASGDETKICRTNFKYMYWNIYQQLAHHTVNGCNITVGDLYASGTISGPTPDSYGSMLELTWRGKNPIKLSNGSERSFVEDGDTIIMRGHAYKDGVRVGFGQCETTILPAKDYA